MTSKHGDFRVYFNSAINRDKYNKLSKIVKILNSLKYPTRKQWREYETKYGFTTKRNNNDNEFIVSFSADNQIYTYVIEQANNLSPWQLKTKGTYGLDNDKDIDGFAYIAKNYNTRGTNKNSNGQKTFQSHRNKKIECRHLSWAFLKQKQKTYSSSFHCFFNGKNNNEHQITEEFDKSMIEERASSYSFLHTDDIGEKLCSFFETMSKKSSNEKNILLSSGVHAMAIKLRIKCDKNDGTPRYIIKFYDPNVTFTHKRFVFKNFVLAQRHLENFLSDCLDSKHLDADRETSYFGIYGNMAALCEYDTLEPNELPDKYATKNYTLNLPDENQIEPSITTFGETSDDLSDDLSDELSGEKGPKINNHLLHLAGVLRFGLRLGITDIVSNITKEILGSTNINNEQKYSLLTAEQWRNSTNEFGEPVKICAENLYLTMSRGYTETMETYLTLILNSNLSDEYKALLCEPRVDDALLPLHKTMLNNNSVTMRSYIKLIAASSLPEQDKVRILLSSEIEYNSLDRQEYDSRKNGPVLCSFMKNKQEKIDIAQTYIMEIIDSELSNESKNMILTANNSDDVPVLYKAIESGHTSAAKMYINTVFLSVKLDVSDKIDLMREVLSCAIKNNNQKVQELIQQLAPKRIYNRALELCQEHNKFQC